MISSGSSFVLAFGISVLMVGAIRRYALSRAMVDRPNHRSSHAVPTPRGGGLGLLVALFPVWAAGGPAWEPEVAVAGVMLVAVVGWLDDRAQMPVMPRLLAHFTAGVCLLPIAIQPAPVPEWMGWAAAAWWVFWSVSAVNVVNFMDGIDGLIGSQMLLFGVHLAVLSGDGGLARPLGLAMAGACGGFLLWNWAPARIFMGDSGSGVLGLTAVLGGVLLLREGSAGLLQGFLPLYPLFLDATVTLFRRAARGERVTQAHRTHLYQRLANGGWGHARVTLLYGLAAAVGIVVVRASVSSPHHAWFAAYAVTVLLIGLVLDRRIERK